jgi:hypothetical protein
MKPGAGAVRAEARRGYPVRVREMNTTATDAAIEELEQLVKIEEAGLSPGDDLGRR